MSQETWELVRRMKATDLELQLAFQCAPLITGMKISNLLSVQKKELADLLKMIGNSDISWEPLFEKEERIFLLLYREADLKEQLRDVRSRRLLNDFGYQSFALSYVLAVCKGRYQAYMEEGKEFPHEMGVLLGYPVEDVEGYIRHQGKEYLCSGYWKVYQNKNSKLQIFQRYEDARESLLQLLSYGMRMADIIAVCEKKGA